MVAVVDQRIVGRGAGRLTGRSRNRTGDRADVTLVGDRLITRAGRCNCCVNRTDIAAVGGVAGIFKIASDLISSRTGVITFEPAMLDRAGVRGSTFNTCGSSRRAGVDDNIVVSGDGTGNAADLTIVQDRVLRS